MGLRALYDQRQKERNALAWRVIKEPKWQLTQIKGNRFQLQWHLSVNTVDDYTCITEIISSFIILISSLKPGNSPHFCANWQLCVFFLKECVDC